MKTIYLNSRKKLIHLYNPREEGLGAYDVNYINAFKKFKRKKINNNKIEIERFAA